MTGRLTLGRALKAIGRKTVRTVTGALKPIKGNQLYYHRGKGKYSRYTKKRDRKVRARHTPHAQGYKKNNWRYAHEGDARKKRV